MPLCCQKVNYLNNFTPDSVEESQLIDKKIKIKSISSAVVNGNSNYYITDTNNKKYKISINVDSSKIPFLKVGDEINISYTIEKDITEITRLK